MTIIIAGDIGGTNSRFSLFTVGDIVDASAPLDESCLVNKETFQKWYQNAKYTSFTDVVADFFKDAEITGEVAAACLAVAGLVADNTATMTNLGWLISGDELGAKFNIASCKLVNDFVGQGYGVLALKPEECEVLQAGSIDRSAPIAMIGAGTGLGQVYLTMGEDGVYTAFPSEGGHSEFAPKTALAWECREFIAKKFDSRVSVERVVSGKGLVNVYDFLRAKFPEKVDKARDEEIMSSPDAGGMYISKGEKEYELAAMAVNLMIDTYGAETGNVALKFLPKGGLFISGGIAGKMIHHLKGADSVFMKAYSDKGRLEPAVAACPVTVVMAEDIGLRGAHVVANRDARNGTGAGGSKGKKSTTTTTVTTVVTTTTE